VEVPLQMKGIALAGVRVLLVCKAFRRRSLYIAFPGFIRYGWRVGWWLGRRGRDGVTGNHLVTRG
jgi:hypothetical protein